MSHRCGPTCRRRRGLPKCSTCRGSGARSASTTTAVNTHGAGALRVGHPDAPPGVASRVCHLCGQEFSNHLGAAQHRCPEPVMTAAGGPGQCAFCGSECRGDYCEQHRYRMPRPRPTAPLPELTPREYANWCMEVAQPVFRRLQTIPKRITAEQDAAIRREFTRCSDLYRIARHLMDGYNDAKILFRLNQVGGVASHPVHLGQADDVSLKIWDSRVAGYMEALRWLLRAGYIVELDPTEFGVPIAHEPF